MKRLLVFLLFFAAPAYAQSVSQSGSITPGHIPVWATNGVLKDGGTAAAGNATSIGTTASGPSICARSAATGAYNRLCIGATSTAGVLSLDNIGGATGGLTISVNGVAQGLVTALLPTTSGDLACFSNSTGQLADCGSTFPSTPFVTGDIFVATNTTTIGRLADVATGSVLTSGGVGALPTYQALIPWTAQVHQNGGGSNNGHVLMWADQNSDVQADHFTLFSYDQSLITSFVIGGTPAAGNTLTITFTINTVAFPIVYTVQAGATTSTIATAMAACINGGSTNCTGGAAFVAAMLAYHGTDGYGYRPQASASTATINMDFPWASSGNSIATGATGGGATITAAANNKLDIGPYYGCGRLVTGRTPVAGDQPCAIQASSQSGPNTGFDSTLGFIINEYEGGGVGTPYGRWLLGGANGSTHSIVSLYVGPSGVATAATDSSGNTCGTFTGQTVASNPGAGSLSVCGQTFLGMQGQTIAPATAAGVETLGVFRVLGAATTPSTGQGLEFSWGAGGPGTILSFNRDTTTYLSLQVLASSMAYLPGNSASKAITHDSNAFWPQTDNSLPLGKTAQRFSNVFATALTTSSAVFNGSSSGSTTLQASATASGTLTLPAATDTLVGKATTDELTNKTLTSSVGKGTWTASGTWTLPAFTLGGTVSGGGNQINNVIIGTVTPLAGTFTTVTASTSVTSPLIIGGSGTTGTQLTIKSTTGNGTTDATVFVGGNNGATTFATLNATKLDIPQSTASSSKTTGALTVAGGLGISGDIFGSSLTAVGASSGFNVTRRDTSANAFVFYSSAGNFQFFSSATSTDVLVLLPSGHLSSATSTTPSVSSCGTGSPAVVSGSTDNAGSVTVGTGTPTACTISFGSAWAAAPKCIVGSNPQVAAFSWTVSTTQIVVTQTATSSNVINFHCGLGNS